MEEIKEQAIDDSQKSALSKTKLIVLAGVAVILIILFLKWQVSLVKTPSQSGKTSNLKQALKPIVINEKPPAEMFMDIKNQLIKAFK